MENNSVSNGATWFPQSQRQEVHEINRPTVITGTRINSKAIYRKDAAVLLSPGASPLVLVSCHDIAAIWVAFFLRWQRYRC